MFAFFNRKEMLCFIQEFDKIRLDFYGGGENTTVTIITQEGASKKV